MLMLDILLDMSNELQLVGVSLLIPIDIFFVQ